jgi:hypothetical protein
VGQPGVRGFLRELQSVNAASRPNVNDKQVDYFYILFDIRQCVIAIGVLFERWASGAAI